MKNMDLSRYARQISFKPFGVEGQQRLVKSSALIVGVGGLGSWAAELLVRAGVGHIRLADDDCVEITNIHRQSLFTEKDSSERSLKVTAAAEHLREINSSCNIEPVFTRMDRLTAGKLVEGMDVIVDGTDNFPARFILNDCAVKNSKPWVFAGVLGSEAQMMTIIPGKTPCLRCLLGQVPSCSGQSCREVGVLGPAVAAVAAFEASEALKILSGNIDRANPNLVVFDFWSNIIEQVNVSKLRTDCTCCVQKNFEFLEP